MEVSGRYLRMRFHVCPPGFEEFERVLEIDAKYGHIEMPDEEELQDIWEFAARSLPGTGHGESYYKPRRNPMPGQTFTEWEKWANELTAVTFRRGRRMDGYKMSYHYARGRFIHDMVASGYEVQEEDKDLHDRLT